MNFESKTSSQGRLSTSSRPGSFLSAVNMNISATPPEQKSREHRKDASISEEYFNPLSPVAWNPNDHTIGSPMMSYNDKEEKYKLALIENPTDVSILSKYGVH